MFVDSADEARLVFGDDYQQIRIDQAKTLSVAAKGGSVNPSMNYIQLKVWQKH